MITGEQYRNPETGGVHTIIAMDGTVVVVRLEQSGETTLYEDVPEFLAGMFHDLNFELVTKAPEEHLDPPEATENDETKDNSVKQFLKDWAKVTLGSLMLVGTVVGAMFLAASGPWGVAAVATVCFLSITALVAALE